MLPPRTSHRRCLFISRDRWPATVVAAWNNGRVTVVFECGARMTVPADKALMCVRAARVPASTSTLAHRAHSPRGGHWKVKIVPLQGVFHFRSRDGFRYSYTVPGADCAMVLYQTVCVTLTASDGSVFKDSFTEAWLIRKGGAVVDHNLCARNWRRGLGGSMVVRFAAWVALPPVSHHMEMGSSLARSGYTYRCDAKLVAREPTTKRRFKMMWSNAGSAAVADGHDLQKEPDVIDGAIVARSSEG